MTPAGGSPGWGILGTGGIARVFSRELRTHGHRVVAVGSRTQEAARNFAEHNDIGRAHGSYERLVADPEVDIVYVATPHSLHAQNALLALDRGKHVLVEKAFTLNAREAQVVVDRAQEVGCVVLEAMWTRFLPHMAVLRSLLADGAIGQVRAVHAVHAQRLPFPPSHRLYDPALGGGALLDLGVYPISFAHDLLGPPVEVTASASFAATGVDASTAVVLTHDGGALSTSYCSMVEPGHNVASVHGTDGRVDIPATWYGHSYLRVHGPDGALVEEIHPAVSGRGMHLQAAELERLVRSGAASGDLMPPAESVEVMRTLDRVREVIGLRFPQE
jgi:predicted dehydrogenase